MNKLSSDVNYCEMKAELQALRKKLEDLETRQAAVQSSTQATARRKLRKTLIIASISSALLVGSGLLWSDDIKALFIDNNGNVRINGLVGINTNPISNQHLVITPKDGNMPFNVTNPAGNVNWLSVFSDGQVKMNGGDVGIANKLSVGGKVTAKGLYVTGDVGEASSGVEFRHTNETQGIGFGYNSIYATGSDANQSLNLVPRGTSGVGIGTTNPQAKLDVKGEIRGKLWYSGLYNWHRDQPATKMTRSDRTVCFLTKVTGYFYGGGEWVEIVDNGGYWYLQGGAQTRDVAATARCVGAPDNSW
jgi:hypothetical protein